MSVGPVLPGDARFESGLGELGGGVVGVDLSSPDPELFDVASESAAFAVELGTLLQDRTGLLGDAVEVVFGGGDVALGGGQIVAGAAAFAPAGFGDGSFELTSMGVRLVEFSAGGFDGVIVRLWQAGSSSSMR